MCVCMCMVKVLVPRAGLNLDLNLQPYLWEQEHQILWTCKLQLSQHSTDQAKENTCVVKGTVILQQNHLSMKIHYKRKTDAGCLLCYHWITALELNGVKLDIPISNFHHTNQITRPNSMVPKAEYSNHAAINTFQ